MQCCIVSGCLAPVPQNLLLQNPHNNTDYHYFNGWDVDIIAVGDGYHGFVEGEDLSHIL